eukprot:SAG31_NODE_748_length_12390_cov_6.306484_6_plen_61_part_00
MHVPGCRQANVAESNVGVGPLFPSRPVLYCLHLKCHVQEERRSGIVLADDLARDAAVHLC